MSKYTPKMDENERKQYLIDHLSNELHWTLYAATEWHCQDILKHEVDGYHVKGFSMDSCYLHARCLFEFFSGKKSSYYYTCKEFGIVEIISLMYGTEEDPGWNNTLHRFLFHAQSRQVTEKLKTINGQELDLNQMPVEVAKEIVVMWGKFINMLQPDLSEIAQGILDTAIANASRILNKHESLKLIINDELEVPPIIWKP